MVTLREDAPGEKRLVAYLVTSDELQVTSREDSSLVTRHSLLVTELRNFLKAKLPDYMIPSAFVALESLPLTVNGKVDRKALPAPEVDRPTLEQEYAAPRTATEEALARIWREVLGLAQVGIHDDFFALGGHSLLALRLMARIQQQFGRSLPLSALFQGATIARQAAQLYRHQDAQAPPSCLVLLQNGRADRRPIFFVHPIGGTVFCYLDLVRQLDPEQPVYGLQAEGLDARQAPHQDIEAMATHYLHLIRTIQPQGPYHLGGWSFGGAVAFEMAQQLRVYGQEVALLALIDSFALQGDQIPDLDPASLLEAFAIDLGLPTMEVPGKIPLGEQWDSDVPLSWILSRAKQADLLPPDVELDRVRHLWRVFCCNHQALRCYRLRPYEGAAILFQAQAPAEDIIRESDLGWGAWIRGSLSSYTIPGDHYSLLRPPNVTLLAQMIRHFLASE